MAGQASTSSRSADSQDIKELHAEMVQRLGKFFTPNLESWEDLLTLLEPYLEPAELRGKDINSFGQICNNLMRKGVIDYGRYSTLYKVIQKIDVRPAKLIQEASDSIKAIQSRETTKVTVSDQSSRPEIISTQAFEDAKEMIRQNSIVVIKGASGDGKTLMCYQLLKWLMDGDNKDTGLTKDPLQLYSMAKWDDIVKPESQLALFIDDISGEIIEELKKREVSIQSVIRGKLNSRSNCLILNVRDETFKSTRMSSCKLFNAENIIDLRGKNLMTSQEKMLILERYVPDIKNLSGGKESEIIKLSPNVGFPQCCLLYRDVPSLQKVGVDFFKKPFHFLKKVLSENLPKKCFAALLFLFLNNGKVRKGDLDPNSGNVDEKKLKIAFHGIDLSHQDKIRSLRKSLGEMLGSLVADDDDDDDDIDDDEMLGSLVADDDDDDATFYKFSHDSVQDTVALLYGEDTKIGFIENCPMKFLRCISTSKTTPNRIVISSNDKTNAMYKRLVREFESLYSDPNRHYLYRYRPITSLDVWTDTQFLQGFIRELSDQNVDKNLCHQIKLELLNEACSSGAEERALYLLSEGVEPDKETPFCVVWGGSVNVLHKLLEYDVTPTARAGWSRSSHLTGDINVLHEACLCEREEMVTVLCDKYPHLVHATAMFGHSTLYLVALTGNCGIFHTVERTVRKYLCRDEDEQHKCERVDGRVVHRSCVCAQYMSQSVNDWGETVLHESCYRGHRELMLYICESFPALTTVVDEFGRHCLHHIARYTTDVDLFTECETHVKRYLESTGREYDITAILDNDGESVLDEAKDRGTENNPLYDHLVPLFSKH